MTLELEAIKCSDEITKLLPTIENLIVSLPELILLLQKSLQPKHVHCTSPPMHFTGTREYRYQLSIQSPSCS